MLKPTPRRRSKRRRHLLPSWFIPALQNHLSCQTSSFGSLRCRSVWSAFLLRFTSVMKSFFQPKAAAVPSAHGFTTLFNVEIPVPALQHGWLHGREFVQPWHAERIAARLGERA